MNENSVFQIVFDFDLSRLQDLPEELDKILKEIESSFSDLSEKIARGTEAIVPNIQNAAFFAVLGKEAASIGIGLGLGKLIDQFEEDIKEFFKRPQTDLERLKNLETEVIMLRRQATAALEDVEKFGERPNAVDENGLSLIKESILGRIDSLNSLLEDVSEVEERLTTLPGIAKQPESVVIPFVPRIPIPIGNITIEPPRLDLVKPIEEELKKILEEGNLEIEERSQLLELLDNALASLGGTTSAFTLGQGLMTDAFIGSRASAVDLEKDGLSPLAVRTAELAASFPELIKNADDSAAIFGFTKEELGNLLDVTEDFTQSTNNLSQDGLQGVIDQTGQASESIDTMSSSVEGVNTAAQTAADGGMSEFSEQVEKLEDSGGFFDGIKQGFIDFAESVGTNSELIADFFANTLSQMSQNFSDLFFNVLTGKFDDLKDLAKQAFEAILRSFLDLVAAIATKQIVVSIAGLLWFGGSAKGAGGSGEIIGSAGDIEDEGKLVVGIFDNKAEVEEIEYRLAA